MGKYFGTDGVRGIANEVLTTHIAYRIGRFIGQYPDGRRNKILIGRDTRISGDMLDAALISGLTRSGAVVYELGITTTPSISYLVEKKGYDFGIMISASHNPYFDNGIKIFAPNGEKLSSGIEKEIEAYIDSLLDYLPSPKNQDIGKVVDAEPLINEYLDYIKSKAKNISSMKIIVDCAHGSASVVARKLFTEMLKINATYINENFCGTDINNRCGSTHLDQLIGEIKKNKFDLGLAFDGDADRLMLVSPNGRVIDGDCTMFLNAVNLKKHGLLADNKIVITTMSNLGLKIALKKNSIDFDEVDVGDKNVQARLKEKKLNLGGEQSGHVIFYEDLNTGDGLLTAVKTMNVISEEKKAVDDLVSGLKILPQILKNEGVTNKIAIMENPELKQLIQKIQKELGEKGRIVVRPSGTEQLIRVMVEAETLEICEKYVESVISLVKELSF